MLPTKERLEKVKSDKEVLARKKAKRKKIMNIATFVLNIVVLGIVLGTSLSNKDGNIGEVLTFPADFNWGYFAVVILLCLCIFVFDSAKLYFLILASTKKSRPFLSFKVCSLGKYYDAITPSSVGGQPFQMMYMNKHGIDGAVATSIPLMKTIFWQISYIFICSLALIYNGIVRPSATNPAIQVAVWISLSIQVIGALSIFMLSISKRIGPRIVIWGLKLLSKMHIVKNYRATFRKTMRFVANYQKTFRTYAKYPWLIVSQFLIATVDTICYNLIPYFIYKSFIPQGELKMIDVFVQSIMCNLSLTFIPTPGSAGGAEAIFPIIFGSAFSGNTFLPVLIWRFVTYYVFLLVGILVLVYDFAIGNKKMERLKRAGADIYNPHPMQSQTFREKLQAERQKINVVEKQESDKLVTQIFSRSDGEDTQSPDIIKDSDIVTPDEMEEVVYSANKALDEESSKSFARKNKRKQKKARKIEEKSSKKDDKKNSKKGTKK